LKNAIHRAVSSSGHPDVRLFFEKDSGLLYKLISRNTDPQTGKQFDREEVSWNYVDVGGMKAATDYRVARDGKPLAELKVSDYKCCEALDDHFFAKP
jgi:hypothetical protein